MLNVHINSKSVIQRVATTITDELGQVGHKDVLQLENNSSVISQHSLSGLLNILANPVWFRPLHYISDRYITFWAECCRKKKGVQQNEQLCVFPIFAPLDGLVHSNQHSLLHCCLKWMQFLYHRSPRWPQFNKELPSSAPTQRNL